MKEGVLVHTQVSHSLLWDAREGQQNVHSSQDENVHSVLKERKFVFSRVVVFKGWIATVVINGASRGGWWTAAALIVSVMFRNAKTFPNTLPKIRGYFLVTDRPRS